MSNFYNKFVALCARDGKSPSAVATELGLSRAAPNGWKNGKKPQDFTIATISAYFNVATSYFTEDNNTDVAVPPVIEQPSKADIENLFAFASDEQKIEWAARLISSLSDNQQAALIQRIMFKK